MLSSSSSLFRIPFDHKKYRDMTHLKISNRGAAGPSPAIIEHTIHGKGAKGGGRAMTRFCVASAAMLLAIGPALALDGQPAMHDPSTVIEAGGKFYVYATGNGLPAFASDDGWTWHRSGSVMRAVPGGKPGPDVIARGGNNTWAPDVIRSGDRYFLYYAAPGPQPRAAVGLLVG